MKHLVRKSQKSGLKATAARREWASQINAAWRKSVTAIFETGRLLIAAKAALDEHGAWEPMLADDLKFNANIARMLMEIARDRRLVKPQIFVLLPPAYTTIYQISRLDDEQLKARATDGTIRCDMTGREILTQIKQTNRAQRESDLGTKQQDLPHQKFGVIVADPEWRFEVWSRDSGLDRSADNHYPTSCTEEIAARDVPSISADDCVLFLWATAPMLPHALTVMVAWGFDYRSHFVWMKHKAGTGYWNRNAHELLLIGVKGKPPAPAPGTQYASVQQCEVTAHSAKPEFFLDLIEQYFPTMPKIELNCRGKARPGWTAWGNEAE